MKLTSKQIKYINNERQKLIDTLEFKKKYNVVDGTLADWDRLRAINLISELHNLEVNNGVSKTQVQELGIPAWLLSLPA